jgi:hypothetical protein
MGAVAMSNGDAAFTAERIRMRPDDFERALVGHGVISAVRVRRLRRLCWRNFGVVFIDTPAVSVVVHFSIVPGLMGWLIEADHGRVMREAGRFDQACADAERDMGWGFVMFAKAWRRWRGLRSRRPAALLGSPANPVRETVSRASHD